MKKLFPYVRPHLKYVGLAALFLLIEVIAETSIPKMMTFAVKYGVDAKSSGGVMLWGGLMIIAALTGCAGGLLGLRFACRASQGAAADIREAMFEKIQGIPSDRFDASSLVLRLGFDVNQIQSLFQMLFRIMIRAPLLFVFALVMSSSINFAMSSIFIAVAVIAGIVIVFVTKVSYRHFAAAQNRLEVVNRIIREDLLGIRDIKAYNLETYEEENFYKAADSHLEVNTGALRRLAVTSPVATMLVNLAAVPILIIGRNNVISGAMAAEDIVAFITYTSQVLLAFMMVSMVLMLWSKAQASADRVSAVLAEASDNDGSGLAENSDDRISGIAEASGSETGAGSQIRPGSGESSETGSDAKAGAQEIRGSLECRNVSFKYGSGSGEPVLDNISFTVKPGQLAGLLGSTGCGKTTLIGLLCGLMDASKGEVLIDGKNIKDYPREVLRSAVVPVLQRSELFSGTLESNIRMGLDAPDASEVLNAAEKARISDFIASKEEGLSAPVQQRGKNLSGGQKQRVALARAFLRDARVLLIDDGINAVDPALRAEILGNIKSMKDVTRIIVTQRAEEVMDADLIFIMEKGRIAAQGTHSELRQSYPPYKDFFENSGAFDE